VTDNTITRAEFSALAATMERAHLRKVQNILRDFGATVRIAIAVLCDSGAQLLQRLEIQSAKERQLLIEALARERDCARDFAELLDQAHARALCAGAFAEAHARGSEPSQ
jgi:hypothetical protein